MPSETNPTRRTALKALASAMPMAALTWTDADARGAARAARAARRRAAQAGTAFEREFFTDHEWETVRLLVDLIIPSDARSGSATEAGVPEFMDFMMIDQPGRRDAMRGGLAWMDRECQRRHDLTFVAASDVQRRAILDDIAWPQRARPEMSHGVAFFNRFRDLTAAGFWTSKMGIEDLGYIGNVAVPDWNGCPDDVLRRLGLPTGGD
jgi:hypothetical protein